MHDLLWYAWEHRIRERQIADETELSLEQVRHAFNDLQRASLTTGYLRARRWFAVTQIRQRPRD